MSDKRKHPRVVVHPPVAFARLTGERFEATCHDLSLGGAFLETSTPAAFGEAILVYLRLPGVEQEIEVESIVRWTRSDGMGVQFGPMGARDTHALVTLLSS
ncbi:MAG: PilZ domain-containing protein [Polyangiaceae bacterium]|nr:PilZ domain-containing protein [Polyangiaceae bacterium]MBK8939301.1 PilZ domain-containing protein [Polyangiaceae bacterium]